MDKTITYVTTTGDSHEIKFHDLLSEGHNMDKHIQNGSLFQRPDHQFHLLKGLLKPSSIVYDIGSYIGTFAIPMAIEGMVIHAFEGFPDNYARCKKNCEPYNITNHLCAVSDKRYSTVSKFNSCMGIGDKKEDNIEYYRLDDYMQENDLPIPDLVKVDIEGMETIALHGMTNLVENIRPIWQMGYHYKFYSEIEGYPGWVDVENGGYDFQNFDKFDYLIYDENGRLCHPSILSQRGGEFIFIPREKIRGLKA